MINLTEAKFCVKLRERPGQQVWPELGWEIAPAMAGARELRRLGPSLIQCFILCLQYIAK